jgi:cytochrome c biogenesis protein CcmG/thiol:disulfide interchange protein DsbE
MKNVGRIPKSLVGVLALVRTHIVNILLALFVLSLVIKQGPIYWSYYQLKGTEAHSVLVKAVDGSEVSLPKVGKHALIFWATWCPPCKVELGRINKLVSSGRIRADQVLAVSVGESAETVDQFAREQKYLFEIAIDEEGLSRAFYKVEATPTILLINDDKKVEWATMGISPTLEYRIGSFLQ